MSAERSTESIIDLLYGELSEEEEREMRAELAESPELQAEYDEYDTMLGRVREAMPLESVSPNIHASILEAARVAAEQPADDRLIRRGTPEKQSFWKRVSGGQGSQIALVAAVLIAGLFVVKFVEQSDSPLRAPASNISSMQEAAPAAPAMAREEVGEGAAGEMPADEAEPAPPAGEAIADQWSPDDDEVNGVVGGEFANDSAEDSLLAELERSRALEDREERKSAVANEPAPAREPAAAKPKPSPRRRSGKKKESKPRPAATKSLEDALDTSVFGDDGSGAKSATSSRQQNVQGKAGVALQQEAEEAEQQAYRPAPGSISEVDTYFREGDYGGAIRAADQFIAKGSGSSTENASAMFIKAQSLAKQGNTRAAESTFQLLKKNYPGFRSAAVEQQLSELQRRNAPKQQKRKAKPKKMDKSAEQPEVDMLYGE